MPTRGGIVKEVKKIFKERRARTMGIGIMSFLVKFAVYFVILTAQFLCAQFLGSAFVTGVPAIIFYLLYIAAFILVDIPITTGAGMCYSKIAMKQRVKTDEVFDCFRDYKKTIGCRLHIAIKILICIAGWYAIGRFVLVGLDVGGYETYSFVSIFVTTVITIFAVASVIAVSITYSAVTYIMVKIPDASPRKTIKMAENIIQYRRMDIFLMYIHCWWRILLCVVTLGIACIWITPFLNVLNKRYIRHFFD